MNYEPTEWQGENEPTPSPQKMASKNPASALFDIVEMFAWSLFVVFLLFTFAFRLCRVDGASMENTLFNGENLLLYSANYTPKQDDIVVFHLTRHDVGLEKTLVKRIIATGGQKLKIDFNTGTILVDGVKYEDTHAVLKDYFGNTIDTYNTAIMEHSYDAQTKTLSLTVPNGCVFVMGDNRNHSKDSRDTDIAFVDERCILGKVVLRLSPFTIFS